MDIMRPAAYATAHCSGPRRARASCSACSRRSRTGGLDKGDPCAFHYGVPSPQNPGCPRIVALQYRRGGERDQCGEEREFVLEVADACEALTNETDRLVWAPAPHRQDGAEIQGPHEEPRTRVPKR